MISSFKSDKNAETQSHEFSTQYNSAAEVPEFSAQLADGFVGVKSTLSYTPAL
jgi:hypothetical protein